MFEVLARSARVYDVEARLRIEGDEYGAQVYGKLNRSSARLDQLRQQVREGKEVDTEEYFGTKDAMNRAGEVVLSSRRSPLALSVRGKKRKRAT